MQKRGKKHADIVSARWPLLVVGVSDIFIVYFRNNLVVWRLGPYLETHSSYSHTWCFPVNIVDYCQLWAGLSFQIRGNTCQREICRNVNIPEMSAKKHGQSYENAYGILLFDELYACKRGI